MLVFFLTPFFSGVSISLMFALLSSIISARSGCSQCLNLMASHPVLLFMLIIFWALSMLERSILVSMLICIFLFASCSSFSVVFLSNAKVKFPEKKSSCCFGSVFKRRSGSCFVLLAFFCVANW